jgi:sarcosine oxidase subunit alpha
VLRSVDVRSAAGRESRIAVDALGVSGGWNPAIGLGCNLGGRPNWHAGIHSYVLDAPAPGMATAGAAAGRLSLADTIRDGARIAGKMVESLGRTIAEFRLPRCSDDPAGIAPLWHVASSAKSFVDFQHDVTDRDIALSVREGFASVEHMKRYTTLGMATDQGKTSQVNANALLALHGGKTIAEAGTVRSRPPYVPVAIGVLAGYHRDEHFRPVRLTPCQGWAEAQGATFVDVGQWKRAQWFAKAGETDWLRTVSREALAVRTSVGICDVSTLGKIEVAGLDAGRLLDRLYINTFSSLPVGKARYGIMLREDGIVMDDGTTTRFAPDRFFVTTTTANAAKVMEHIDYCRQVLWPDLDVQAVSVTEQWAQLAVAGPNSRTLLQRLFADVDLSNAALPYMAAIECVWRGVPVRLFRISFSGELAYEVAVPADFGDALIRALFDAGAHLGVTAYGTEALSVLRIEKGHPAGNELNGQTTAADLGFARMMSRKKGYVGHRLADRPGLVDEGRPALVGISPVDPAARPRGGAHLLPIGARAEAGNDQGYVTSVAYSPTLGRWIGLALMKRGRGRIGERVRAVDLLRGSDVAVDIVDPVFVDAKGERLRG